MKLRRFGARKKARIEIIPMIDTMFFLLVFFMVATMSMTVMRGLPVNLPQGASGERKIEQRSITVAADGSIYLDREPMGLEGLARVLKDESQGDPEALIVINADESVSHGRVVEVMDTVKLSGIKRLAIATKPR